MRVLITGGAGFIGSHIAEHYQGKAEVRILDNLRTGYLANLEGLDVDFIAGDILDKDTLAKAMEGVDYVFHLAAMISVPESMEKPVECVRMNAEGTLNVLEAAAAAGAKKLCFSTSAATYGDNPPSRNARTCFRSRSLPTRSRNSMESIIARCSRVRVNCRRSLCAISTFSARGKIRTARSPPPCRFS